MQPWSSAGLLHPVTRVGDVGVMVQQMQVATGMAIGGSRRCLGFWSGPDGGGGWARWFGRIKHIIRQSVRKSQCPKDYRKSQWIILQVLFSIMDHEQKDDTNVLFGVVFGQQIWRRDKFMV